MNNTLEHIELSIVMPCLNEAETLATCIKKAQRFLERCNIKGEVVVADNGSTDGSREIALAHNAVLVEVPVKGYGSAIRGGIEHARAEFVIVGDSDDSHDLENLELFYEGLKEGVDLVVGNRFKGGLSKKDMPFMHRYVGNPVLTGLGNLFFKSKLGDFHCGLRGLTKEAFYKMNLATTGMEFASEMIVKATLHKLMIREVPTKVFPSGRSRDPHLRTWPDGWRHLRFLLLYSPKWLFLYPGVLLAILGLISMVLFIPRPITASTNLLLGTASITLLVGYQFMLFNWLTRIYATNHGLIPETKKYRQIFTNFTLERGLVFGLLLMIIGFLFLGFNFDIKHMELKETNFVFVALVCICIAVQSILFSFFFSILGLKSR